MARSLSALEYSREEQAVDEQGIRNLLEAVVHRKMEWLDRAMELLTSVLETPMPRGTPHDEWMGNPSHPRR